jgi:hypothetical protein
VEGLLQAEGVSVTAVDLNVHKEEGTTAPSAHYPSPPPTPRSFSPLCFTCSTTYYFNDNQRQTGPRPRIRPAGLPGQYATSSFLRQVLTPSPASCYKSWQTSTSHTHKPFSPSGSTAFPHLTFSLALVCHQFSFHTSPDHASTVVRTIHASHVRRRRGPAPRLRDRPAVLLWTESTLAGLCGKRSHAPAPMCGPMARPPLCRRLSGGFGRLLSWGISSAEVSRSRAHLN